MQNGFSQAEYRRRIESVRDRIQEKGLDGALVLDPYNVFYLGLYYYPGKRPVMLYIHNDGTVLAVTPAMEAHEARKVPHFDVVTAYQDNYAPGSDLYDKMIEELGDVVYVPGGPAGALVPSGPRTALPHALPSGRTLQPNEPMILSCGANVWGYRTECERTFFVGSPSPAWRKAFEVMRRAQEMAIELMQPGAVCQDIDRQVLDFIRSEGYGDYVRHRTGHGKGLEEHEPPYIALGDETVIQPGMIFSSEPGIYIEGMSGFRHSDIIWVSENGPEVLTQYPKDLDSMIIPL